MTDQPDNTTELGNSKEFPAIETRWSPDRREWNLLVRRPFYLCLRLGLTQNALWIGRRLEGDFRTIFNRFPLKRPT